MPASKAVELYRLFEDNGVNIWVDGGWGVDALLGEQTREHADLDFAIDREHEARMKELLDERGFKEVAINDRTDWNYVLSDGENQVDVHVFSFDEAGNNSYGTAYPKDSLTGTGKISGQTVRCIEPKWMVKFHTGYNLTEADRHDVAALCQKFNIPLPPEHQTLA